MAKETNLNPQEYAEGDLNVLMNSHGAFSHVQFGVNPSVVSVKLQAMMSMTLVRRLAMLSGAVTSVFELAEVGALIMVKENGVCRGEECDDSHYLCETGEVTVVAKTHDGLVSALAAMEIVPSDLSALDC